MAVDTQNQGHYFKVLERHKRKLGDYEQIHFNRRSMLPSVVPRPSVMSRGKPPSQFRHSVAPGQIALTSRRSSKTHLVPFDKSTAAMYLRQTEQLWLMPNLSRPEAAKMLFDKQTGSFVVRNSQKARYALSVRLEDKLKDDLAVKHFLIQTNQQRFLTIQGSNLPFLSIFDLLAYFCFNQSGGMPCLLRPPVKQEKAPFSESSDSSSDELEGEDEEESLHRSVHQDGDGDGEGGPPAAKTDGAPPPLPPRTDSMMDLAMVAGTGVIVNSPGEGASKVQRGRMTVLDQFPTHEAVTIDTRKQEAYISSKSMTLQSQDKDKVLERKLRNSHMDMQEWPSPTTGRKKVPPPKPPRTDLIAAGIVEGESSSFTEGGRRREREREREKRVEGGGGDESGETKEELKRVVRRVSSIVDMNDQELTRVAKSTTPVRHGPRISVMNTQELPHLSTSAPSAGVAIPKPKLIRRRSNSSDTILRPPSIKKAYSNDPRMMRHANVQRKPRAKVSNLIKMFEAKSPDHHRREQVNVFNWTPPSPRRRSNALSEVSSSDSTESSPSHGVGRPYLPPKPQYSVPPVPPKPIPTTGEGPPTVPPRTPAPLVPPKPPGSKPPTIVPRMPRQRSHSDSDSKILDDGLPPRVPPKRSVLLRDNDLPPSLGGSGAITTSASVSRGSHYEQIEFYGMRENEVAPGIRKEDDARAKESRHSSSPPQGWLLLTDEHLAAASMEQSERGEGGGGKGAKAKWISKPSWAKKLQIKPRRPRKRIKKFIMNLAADKSQEFGKKVDEFISEVKGQCNDPHQKMLSQIRNFMTSMRDYLLEYHKSDLAACGMESCDNFEHVMETTLQLCILRPLSHYVYLRIEEYYTSNGFLYQVQRSIQQGKLKKQEEFGIRKHLVVPNEKAIAEINDNFAQMKNTFCAISKLEYLLEAVRLTYESIKDSRNPKKPMNDLGADDFLPLFVWVLVQCGFHRAEIEAEYMWGLAHPSLFNGEGGYYLTTLTSAVNVLKELTQPPAQPMPHPQQLPTMNNLQTELKVYFEDENTGQYSSAYYLPIVPNMTAAEICDIIAEKHCTARPQDYGLFTVVNGRATLLEDGTKPQEILMGWTLEPPTTTSTGTGQGATSQHQPSSQFIAYKLRAPGLTAR